MIAETLSGSSRTSPNRVAVQVQTLHIGRIDERDPNRLPGVRSDLQFALPPIGGDRARVSLVAESGDTGKGCPDDRLFQGDLDRIGPQDVDLAPPQLPTKLDVLLARGCQQFIHQTEDSAIRLRQRLMQSVR